MNNEYPFLAKAPIVEAVLEIRTIPAPVWEEKDITEKAKSLYAGGYTYENENKYQYTMQFDLSIPAARNVSEAEWNGIRLTSGDKTEILKITRDAYVYSRLQPYPGWGIFNENALKGWADYREISGKQKIKRIGIRFINRIEFSNGELPELLSIFPVKVGKIDKDISGYFQQNIYAFSGGEYFATFIQTVQAPENNSGKQAVILDIDVCTSEALHLNEKDILSYLEQIRLFKNDIFFGAVKDKLIGRLK